MISVCMATYNGEKFIEKQLLTILNQTRQPDEVIICDDGSKDNTVIIIQKFIEQYNLTGKWKIYQNKENKGYPGNFYYAMGLCEGDLVFLADQDDIWDAHKIEIMSQIMERESQIEVLSSTMGIMDADGKELHGILAPPKKNDGKLISYTMQQLMYKDAWAGMVMVYRNSFYHKIKERVENTEIPHDRALWTLATQDKGFYQVNRVLAYHRRHETNTCEEEHRIGKTMRSQRKLGQIDTSMQYLHDLLRTEVGISEENRPILEEKLEILKSRKKHLQERKIMPMIKDYFKYKGKVRLMSLLCDVGIVLLGK